MLAHKGIVKAQLVGINDGLSVLMQSLGSVPLKGMQGHGEIA